MDRHVLLHVEDMSHTAVVHVVNKPHTYVGKYIVRFHSYPIMDWTVDGTTWNCIHGLHKLKRFTF